MKVTLIISVYKNMRFLKKVLDSLTIQHYKNFEVIVSEDGDFPEMKQFIDKYQVNYEFSILHLSQEDFGFRKNKALNKAIQKSSGELIVFIDDDCVLHPAYMQEYVKHFDENAVMFSKRTELDAKTTEQLLNSEQIIPTKWRMLINKTSRIEDSIYLPFKPTKFDKNPRLMGCNMAFPKKILTAVNGFDEDFQTVGYGEDTDIEWRVSKAGYKFINLKHKVIVFHLHHERNGREDNTKIGRALMHQKMEEGNFYCKNGLKKL